MENEHLPIEEMEFFRWYVEVADWIWDEVVRWDHLGRDTVGKQLVRAADSVGANLVEGDGRYSDADALHFFIIARASARETRYWLERAAKRGLLKPTEANERIDRIKSASRLLNRLITYRRRRVGGDRVREPRTEYDANSTSDPLTEW